MSWLNGESIGKTPGSRAHDVLYGLFRDKLDETSVMDYLEALEIREFATTEGLFRFARGWNK